MLPPLVPLLKQDTTRSDAPESPPAASPIQPTTASIELEELAPSANLAFHSATGKFAERAHETAFAARLFRLAYPGHVLLMALAPLHEAFGVKRAIVSTYQAASGAGAEGMTELEQGARQYLAGEPVTASKFAHPLAFNLIPHIDSFQDNGYTREEMKVLWEPWLLPLSK